MRSGPRQDVVDRRDRVVELGVVVASRGKAHAPLDVLLVLTAPPPASARPCASSARSWAVSQATSTVRRVDLGRDPLGEHRDVIEQACAVIGADRCSTRAFRSAGPK